MNTGTASSYVVDTTRSRYAVLRPVALEEVEVQDQFWGTRLDRIGNTALFAQYRQLEETGRLDNFRRALDPTIPFKGYYFNDSDVYKWLEAAAWIMALRPSDALHDLIKKVRGIVLAAQQPDGYLDNYFLHEKAEERWSNLRDLHELYCAGHFIQAAVALYRMFQDQETLDAALRLANLICTRFGPTEQGKIPGVPGREEIETALVELYRLVGDEKYLAQARYFIDSRGKGIIGGRSYHQDHLPFTQMEAMVGHAVRALYLNSGAADVYLETGDLDYLRTLERLWGRLVLRQTYLTGGIGSRDSGEALGDDYELPNGTAYAETCASVASVMWNYRMLLATCQAKYADQIELVLYNGVLSGWSLDGLGYFYTNPLAERTGTHRRSPWFSCACCPPNLARLIASLPSYLCSVNEDSIWIHLYAAANIHTHSSGGASIHLAMDTDYPWDGSVQITVIEEGDFQIRLRIPGWSENGQTLVQVNGKPQGVNGQAGTYFALPGPWRSGDRIDIRFPVVVRFIQSHPAVVENRGHVAAALGPLIYCCEGVDHPGVDFDEVFVYPERNTRLGAGEGDLEGMRLILMDGAVTHSKTTWEDRLYFPLAQPLSPLDLTPIQLTAVPYFAWANRDPGPMTVWLRKQAENA